MLTLDVLYAVLLGVHPEQLTFLDDPWRLLCYEIYRLICNGADPLAALKLGLQNLVQSQPESVTRLVKEMQLARQLPGLSSRQKQALIALRYANVASLKQLCKILVADRRNTHRRLQILVSKGYALKFVSEKDGASYVAVPETFTKGFKAQVNKVLLEQIQDVLKGFAKSTQPTQPTLATTPTHLT